MPKFQDTGPFRHPTASVWNPIPRIPSTTDEFLSDPMGSDSRNTRPRKAWIYHWRIGDKSANVSWITEGESSTAVARQCRFQPKTLFSTFSKLNGPVLVHAVDKDKAVDHNYYIENCLKPVFKEIRKQKQSCGTEGIKLLQDNARPHTQSDVINYLTKEGIVIVPHPPYSLDLAPCDY